MTRKAKKGGKRKRQKTGLNRSILDVGWGMMRGMLEYKEVEAPTQQLKPSQRCLACWEIKPKTLAERMHICPCGCTEDRDVASAQVCLKWATELGTSFADAEGQSPSKAVQSSSTSQARRNTGSLKQLAETKRLKPQPRGAG